MTNNMIDTDATAYRAAVVEGKSLTATISGKQWLLGDLADKVEKEYGESRLERFAADINFPGAGCTLSRYRSVCLAFPKTGRRPRFFAAAQALQAHPNRIAIVEENPDISKLNARENMRLWRAEQAGTAPPAGEADEFADDDLLDDEREADIEPTPTDAEQQPDDQDLIEPQEDAELTDEAETEPTAPEGTLAPAKEAKAKGPKKKETEEEATLKENRRLLNIIVDIARAAL